MASNRRAFLTGGVLAGGAALATPALSTPRAPEYLPDAVFPESVLNFDLSVLEQARATTVEIFPEDPRTATGHRVRARHGSGFLTKVDDLVHAAILTPGIAVVTNSHVVDGRETIWVRTFEGQVFEAPVRYDDAARDVAIIASPIEAGLSTLKLADTLPAFGAPVAALGAPFGYTGTVTRGFINNTTVTFRDEDAVDYLQHDAAIGHGSSGGPLLNADGEVIGINTAIPDDSVGFAGIGLATPAKHIHEALSRAHENRTGIPWLGLQLQQISPEIASAIGWQNRAGLLVANVQANSPAAAAGIKAGDIIADVENTRLNTLRDLGKLLLDKVPEQTLDQMSVHRLKDGRLTEDAEIIETLQIEWRTSKRQHSTTVSAGPAKRHLEHG
ncbi:MAG: trypsin-like peptidase domain-containing protein, partial [Pseudomonadota bacterium]